MNNYNPTWLELASRMQEQGLKNINLKFTSDGCKLTFESAKGPEVIEGPTLASVLFCAASGVSV